MLDALSDGDRLCHGDLHPGNMLGTASGPVVIDWGDASCGDPLGDVVRSAVLMRVGEPPPGAPRLVRLLARGGGSLLSARYAAHYRKRRDVDLTDVARWRAVRAAARLAEPVPEEHPRLLKILRRDLDSTKALTAGTWPDFAAWPRRTTACGTAAGAWPSTTGTSGTRARSRTGREAAWRITCFFVGKGHRRKGVADAALDGALEEIERLGGGVVEGYPDDPTAGKLSAAFLWCGTTRLFERHGFEVTRAIGKSRRVARRRVG